jgi:hypothetical protein
LITGFIALIFVSFLTNGTEIFAGNINPGIYSKDSAPHEVPYGQWLAKWWNWTTSITKENHPRDNFTPEKCQINQLGPVWFLPDMLGGYEDRTCIIPSDKSIFVPILVGECELSSDELKTKEQLPPCASAGNEHGVISATVDGKKVTNIEDYRAQSGFFNITIVENNIYDSNPGTWTGFADGFFIMLEPLSPGEHEVKLTVSVLNPTEPKYNYDANWTYHLVIQNS